ncbi:isocitrate lyase/PEP mutase family protein [Lysinibacillus odysseyi]|uniref:Carboxyphosphonoenolpyruvate phosphonomutase n=1 Tax=Lysinibacillus odysseyi 34hs-1 = NBRC 100172 TaxID=1220589 RepID=A0A0A3JEM0_9BACI|nr:isocitrate lyase/phosphoenolpyruvate mutase family protein [Lysinibacillus odysseyi]KGR85497.1 carboxyphosphonoenolpyruvate phosphonomutase [Lysinibacillus odysseyi 34hs-1 = NBRC 100172]
MNKIREFKEMHFTDELLFLGNAWDVLSAITLEKAGFKAIGTTSWGIASSLGFADGELIDFDRHLGIIEAIIKNVNIPVTADIEAGYGEDFDVIVENVLRTADAGAAGINIEDSLKQSNGLRDVSAHCCLLEKIRTALDNNSYKDFYVNARTDTYFQRQNPLMETIERAKAYVVSGASGIFVPGLKEDDEIKEIVLHVNAPLNVLSLPELTNCHKLKELGVKRFSFGNTLSDQVIDYIEKSAGELLASMDTAYLYEM